MSVLGRGRLFLPLTFGLTLAASLPAASAPDNYIISIGDLLELDILEDTIEPQRFSVGSNGQVQLPLIGGVAVEGASVTEASARIRDTYVAREIFVRPTVELSIASFRPVFVLGDVKSPGNYAFQLFLTAEQAAGLAGGVTAPGGNEEQRVLERRDVEGTLTGIEAELARLATQLARIEAQLSDAETIDWFSVPEAIRAEVDRGQFDALAPAQDQILLLDRQDRSTRQALLQNTVTEAEARLDLLAQRVELTEGLVTRSRDEIERTRAAVKRGIKSQSALAEEEQALARLDVELLRLREERSAALVQIGTLRNELTRLETDRTRALLAERQQLTADTTRERARRGAARDRLALLTQWIQNGSGQKAEILVDFEVKRRGPNGMEELSIRAEDELMPGDLLTVRVRPTVDLVKAGAP